MKTKSTHPLSWLPSLYFAEGLPYMLVVVVSAILYKNLGISNTDIAFYTGLFYLPWVLKPLWSPFIDTIKNTKFWIVSTQLVIGVLFGLIGLTLPMGGFFKWSLIFMWLIAFSSATHDIAADGYYIQALNPHKQSFYVGFRSLFYRLAMIAVQGGLVAWVGYMHLHGSSMPEAWQTGMIVLAILFIVIGLYHFKVIDQIDTVKKKENISLTLKSTFKSFFQKKGIVPALAFIMLYRLGEAQLSKMATPFFLDSRELGGLGFNNEQVGLAVGTVGIIGLIIGGISGGFLVSKHGLKRVIWPMVIALNLPNVIYIVMAYYKPDFNIMVQAGIFIEQFGYGFGFTALMLYILMLSEGRHSTAHYAFATGFMALGMMLPSMISGWLQTQLGYLQFFIWVLVCAIPSFVLIPYLNINTDFGKKTNSKYDLRK